jgi:hypothetical protein
MNRRSAMIMAAGLVFMLMAGTVSRAVTFHPTSAAAPIQIVVQTPASAAAAATAPIHVERD